MWVKRGKFLCAKYHVNAVQNETNKIIQAAKKTYIDNLSAKICDPRSGGKVFWNAYNVYKRLINNKKTPT